MSALAAERDARARCRLGPGIEPEPEAVGEPRQMVEDPDDVRDLEAGLVVEADLDVPRAEDVDPPPLGPTPVSPD
jgi:hypothetical protein